MVLTHLAGKICSAVLFLFRAWMARGHRKRGVPTTKGF